MEQSQKFSNNFNKKMWQENSLPQPNTEESILLRVLVQAMVIVGIIATDIAAQTQMSLWAIPLSILGAVWSWYRRKKRNVSVKFLLAIAMLTVMFAFFGNLIANFNDTRLILAQLLIQVQVLHSFDLPRRKDLGYSMIIGLILVAVSGTISQTVAFAPFLLIFIGLAIPTLVLDYRSRLSLEPIEIYFSWDKQSPSTISRGKKLNFSPLAPKSLVTILLIILGLGLAIFAVMPRFPGYQIQTFPVSSPIDLDNKNFDAEDRSIINPGYVSRGNETGDGNGSGEDSSKAPLEGKGQIDYTFYYGFNSKINQNLRGQLKEKTVMRVRSQAPGFWQVLSFDRYTGQGWEVSRDKQTTSVERSNLYSRFYVPNLVKVKRTKKVVQSYTIVANLPNLIPALSYPQFVYFPTRQIAIDPEGSLRSPIALGDGLTYTIISQIPYRDRTLLRQAPQEYSKIITEYYLQIPPKIKDKVKKQTEELLAKSQKPLTSPSEKALYLTQALKQNYTLENNLPFFEDNEDLVESFLFKYQGGYADHFSTVLTIMLRSIGIPARLAAGFSPGQFNPFTGYYIVKNTDAFALTQVYFPNYGWFDFDPIPGHEIVPVSFQQDQTFGILAQLWKWVAGWLPAPITSFLAAVWTYIIGGILGLIAKILNLVSSSLLGAISGLIILTILGLMIWLGWNQFKNINYNRRLAKLDPIERLYLRMLKVLGDRGFPKHPAQTPLEYAQNSHERHEKILAEVINDISAAYVAWKYGKRSPNIEYLQQEYKGLIRGLRRSV